MRNIMRLTSMVLAAALVCAPAAVSADSIEDSIDTCSTLNAARSVDNAKTYEELLVCETETELKEAEESVVLADVAEATEEESSEKLAIASAEDYAEVYETADADSAVVGKLYTNNLATVLEEGDEMCLISSGNVTGYVASDALSIGDDEEIASATVFTATVQADVLMVREEPSTDAAVLAKAEEGSSLLIVSTDEDGWVEVVKDDITGFVSEDYVVLENTYTYAETLEEEEARLLEEAKPLGQRIADYACQFVGNPYKYGGTSLTEGTDCSGFVKSVYAHFGYTLPHSSTADRSKGRSVSLSEAQPGDIVCYSGHVGLYIGDGKIVHAAGASTGIIISDINYPGYVLDIRRIAD